MRVFLNHIKVQLKEGNPLIYNINNYSLYCIKKKKKKKDTLLVSVISTFTMGKYGSIGGTMVKFLLEFLVRCGRLKN